MENITNERHRIKRYLYMINEMLKEGGLFGRAGDVFNSV